MGYAFPLLISFLLLRTPPAAAPCISSPLQVRLSDRFVNADSLTALLTIAQRHHVCLGIEGVDGLASKLSIDATNMNFGDFIKRAAPLHRVSVAGRVLHIRGKPYHAGTWLDLSVNLCTNRKWDVLFVSNVL